MRYFNRIGYLLFQLGILVGIVLMYRLTVPYTAFQPDIEFLHTKRHAYTIGHWRLSFYVHVFTSLLVLISGLLQFSPSVLHRIPRLHRWSGYVYCTVVLLFSGPSGLVMGFYANGGLPACISFVLMASLWLFFTGRALTLARKGAYVAHAQFMARSFALSLSAITLRAYSLLIGLFNIDIRPAAAYILIAWLSWTVNILIAEIWIKSGGIERFMSPD
jgi:hypothetical protein